jgi:hypothetical protein
MIKTNKQTNKQGMGKRGEVARSSGDHIFFSASSSLVDISSPRGGGPPMDSDSDDEFGEGGWDEEEIIDQVAGNTSEWSSYGDHPLEYGRVGVVPARALPENDDGGFGEEDLDNYDNPNFTSYDAESEYHLSGLPDNYQWKSSAPRWEVPEQGGIGKRDPELEKDIFSHHLNAGINFKKYDDIPVQVTGNDLVGPITKVIFSLSLFFSFDLFLFRPFPSVFIVH